MVNAKLQEWAEKKKKIVKKWQKEYESICKEEGIEGAMLVNIAFDSEYIASIWAFDRKSENYVMNTEPYWRKNEKSSKED